MVFGLALAFFLISLVFLATSSWDQWQLDKDAPLDVDDLPLPWAGYGSSTVSLSALFGAYSATLLVLGPACFTGVVLGVLGGLLLTGRWISRLSQVTSKFQELLFSSTIFKDPRPDRIYWLLLSAAQFGLAISELVLLQQVFRRGLGFTQPYSIAATLAIALVCYFYCLLTGYQAVFRTDVLQYIVLLAVCVLLLLLPSSLNETSEQPLDARQSISAVPFGPEYLALPTVLRGLLDLLVGISLGMMPILGAPDTWKRVLLLQQKHGTGKASLILLAAAAAPLVIVLLLFSHVASESAAGMFPLRFIFSTDSIFVRALLLFGMISAFMSTFDSANVSGVHILLKIKPLLPMKEHSERQRFHILLGCLFSILAFLFVAFSERLPHPYTVGIFLLGPVGIVVGLLTGTSLGIRRIAGSWPMSVAVASLVLWTGIFYYYWTLPDNDKNPATALAPVGIGASFYFLFWIFGRMASRPQKGG